MIYWKKGPRRQGIEKTKRSRVLRVHGTEAERRLWQFLRNRQCLGLKFRRQVSFGPFYLDFYCADMGIAIELDGGQHYTPKGRFKDFKREKYLRALGIKVFRYSDRDILLHTENVLESIICAVQEGNPHPNPLLSLRCRLRRLLRPFQGFVCKERGQRIFDGKKDTGEDKHPGRGDKQF